MNISEARDKGGNQVLFALENSDLRLIMLNKINLLLFVGFFVFLSRFFSDKRILRPEEYNKHQLMLTIGG